MPTPQPAILTPAPALGRFLSLSLSPGSDPRATLDRLAGVHLDKTTVLGLGAPFVRALGTRLEHLRPFRALAGRGVFFPSTQGALWLSFGGDDAGALLMQARGLLALLGDAFRIDEDVLAFRHGAGRDLTGFEDGTENPKGPKAVEAAIVSGLGLGQDGGSYVSTQRWVHDLARFERLTANDRDLAIGRRRETNEEIADAPASAHVKRTAQESFDPPAFMVRRSMPYGSVTEHGLYFVAYASSLDPFERQLTRMAGLEEDGVVDALMQFSRAVSGGAYWCPPLEEGRLDLRALT
jgi:putative iron-dependent peroxidase